MGRGKSIKTHSEHEQQKQGCKATATRTQQTRWQEVINRGLCTAELIRGDEQQLSQRDGKRQVTGTTGCWAELEMKCQEDTASEN